MKVRLKTLMAGPAGTHHAGSVVDLPAGQAGELVRAGYAIAMEIARVEPPEVAVATVATQEFAVARPAEIRRPLRRPMRRR